jgi:hypothetical protein
VAAVGTHYRALTATGLSMSGHGSQKQQELLLPCRRCCCRRTASRRSNGGIPCAASTEQAASWAGGRRRYQVPPRGRDAPSAPRGRDVTTTPERPTRSDIIISAVSGEGLLDDTIMNSYLVTLIRWPKSQIQQNAAPSRQCAGRGPNLTRTLLYVRP